MRLGSGKRQDTPQSDDPYDILRGSAGPAANRVSHLLGSGRRPSNRLLDRAVRETRARAEHFFEAVGASLVGRGFFSGPGLRHIPELGAAPVMVYATEPPSFRDARYWLLDGSGALAPHHLLQSDGYSPSQMHDMAESSEFTGVDEPASDNFSVRWAVAAGEVFETLLYHPDGLEVYEAPDPTSAKSVIEPGVRLRMVDFKGDWTLIESTDGEPLGWSRHRDDPSR